jgi:hypothetical protein
MTGLLALACMAMFVPMSAQAQGGTVNFKPGALKAAIADGKTVLLHYKSTW